MNAQSPDLTLDDIRQEIDAIDEGILALLEQRVAASERVRSVKGRAGQLSASPIRPAREAEILRRLLARRSPRLDAELVVRLWRVILTSSTLKQKPVSVHASHDTLHDADLRALIADQFCATPVHGHRSERELSEHLAANPGDIAVVKPDSAWTSTTALPPVIGRLPVLAAKGPPALLVLGRSISQPTGQDETLVVGNSDLPEEIRADVVWTCLSGGLLAVALRGYRDEPPSSAWAIAGRYPSSIEV